jgi:RNA polymerase sigma-70 factor (ECF subfamily)
MWMLALVSGRDDAAGSDRDQAERELVTRCLAGDRAALNRLFDDYYPQLRRIMLRLLGAHEELEDAIQNALLEMYRNLKSFRGDARLSTWVYRIALNVANQHLRRHMRHPAPRELDPDAQADHGPGALDLLVAREEVELLWDIVRAMPASKRDVFVLAELEGLAPAEIAAALKISPSAAYTRLHHARRLFWDKIKRQGPLDPGRADHED